jgi:hypothetical protein
VTGPVRERVCASAGAEKIHSRLRPENYLISVTGPGFDSRQLHPCEVY